MVCVCVCVDRFIGQSSKKRYPKADNSTSQVKNCTQRRGKLILFQNGDPKPVLRSFGESKLGHHDTFANLCHHPLGAKQMPRCTIIPILSLNPRVSGSSILINTQHRGIMYSMKNSVANF